MEPTNTLTDVFVSLGSNVEPEHYLPAAVQHLDTIGTLAAVSRVYQSKAFGLSDQRDFLNAAAWIQSTLTLAEITQRLRSIEGELGRRRSGVKSAPRRIDLDLCMFGEVVLSTDECVIPHPDVLTRAYVTVPLAELAPTRRHPVTGETLKQIADRLAKDTTLIVRPDVACAPPRNA